MLNVVLNKKMRIVNGIVMIFYKKKVHPNTRLKSHSGQSITEKAALYKRERRLKEMKMDSD